MSMLAERKTKKKWCLNPRGKEWAQDSNKFGQKMLEKMGWQHGKGLGPDGKGITEHIKISYKNDSKGMGYLESDDQWTEHESNFTSLLASLNGAVEKPDDIKVSSLEKKSQTSRSRVHYHKFTRGKDLSRYSEKDLANIFGKKTFQDTENETKQEEKTDSNGEGKNDSKFLLNAGSMRDYFKKKIPNFGKINGYVVGQNGVLKKDESESESEMRPSFGFGYNQKDDTNQADNNCEDVTIKSEVTPDRNSLEAKEKGKVTFVSYISAEENLESNKKKNKKKRKGEECNDDCVLSPKKKSKTTDEETPKKKSKAKVEENLGLSNPAFNPLPTPIKVQKHHLNTIQESISESSVLEDDSPKIIETQAEVYENGSSEVPKKKKKSEVTEVCSNERKQRKKPKDVSNDLVNDAVVEVVEDTPKRKHLTNGLENPMFNGSVENESCSKSTEENPYEVIVKKKKKKESKLAVDNPNFVGVAQESTDLSQIEENPYEVKVKRKKKKKDEEQFALENPNFDSTLENTTDSALIEVNPYEVTVKEKKKKKVKDETFALSNPSFNESPESSTNSSRVEENPYEVKIKKKSKKTKHLKEASSSNVLGEETWQDVPEKKKKKEKKEAFAMDNPYFDPNDSVEVGLENNVLEVERKKKKSKKSKNEGGIVNPALNLDTSQSDTKENHTVENVEIEESDLMLNIVTTPIIAKTKAPHKENTYSIRKVNSVKRTKSVRFSDVTQERIIPNNDDIEFDETCLTQLNGDSSDPTGVDGNQSKKGKKRKLGLDNGAFDRQKNTLEENLDSISKTIDMYQAEIENDINEKKLETFQIEDIMVGEVGNPHGENEKLPDGSKLKFKYAQFKGKTPFYQLDSTGAKKAYKHLIKGDIVLKFKNTNLHEIEGYAVKKKGTV